jgi:cyclase
VAVRVTSDGVILVDDLYEANYDHIVALVKTVTPQPVKYVISTHHHADHTGANARFVEHAQVLGHKNARAAMTGGAALPGPPPITYTTEAAVHRAAPKYSSTTSAVATPTATQSSIFRTCG